MRESSVPLRHCLCSPVARCMRRQPQPHDQTSTQRSARISSVEENQNFDGIYRILSELTCPPSGPQVSESINIIKSVETPVFLTNARLFTFGDSPSVRVGIWNVLSDKFVFSGQIMDGALAFLASEDP